MMTIDLTKPVTIRGYTGTVVSLETNTVVMATPYYDIEIVDLTPDANHIMMRMVSPNEVSPCV